MPTSRKLPPALDAPKPSPLPGGLLYVSPLMPGFTRVRAGERFAYRRHDGARIADAGEIERIDRLAIPPAYTGVWICPLPNGHLQATGLDARGRRQYRYHPQWRSMRDEGKFERIEAFGRALPRIRARVMRDLHPARGGSGLSRTVVLATLVRLLDTTYIRVGNEAYAERNGSYGLTTLRNLHAGVRGSVLTLKFRGKSGVMQEIRLDDPKVARVVRGCQQLPGQELFHYLDEDGAPHRVDSADVNDYLRAAAGADFTAKDFRTWHGTVQALELTRLACGDTGETAYSAKAVLAEVARQLGNTPAVCRKSYVHPAVLQVGTTLAAGDESALTDFWQRVTGRQKTPRRLRAAEHRLLGFLREHRKELRGAVRRKARPAGFAAAAPAAAGGPAA